MQERIKKLRKTLNLTQQEFADRLKIKRGALANYEIGRNEPIDAVVSLICREFNVSEVWLRSGEGEMFLPRDESAEIAEYVGSILSGEDTAFQRRLISLMSKLPPETWHLIEEKAREVFASDP